MEASFSQDDSLSKTVDHTLGRLEKWKLGIEEEELTTTKICNDQIWTTSIEPIHDYLDR